MGKWIIDLLMLPMLFFIGLVTSYEDLKYGKVRNKWIILGLAWGLLVLIGFTLWYLVASPITHFYYSNILKLPSGSPVSVFTVNISYLLKSFLNAFLAFLIGFLIWRSGAWAAGDAKLFFVYALLIPLTYYWKSYLPYFPSFVLLINIFIPILFYLLIRSLVYYLKFLYLKIKQGQSFKMKKGIKDLFERIRKVIKNMYKMLFILLTIFLGFGLLQEPVYRYTSFNISTLLMFVIAGFIIFASSISKLFHRPIVLKIFIVVFVILLAYGLLVSFEKALSILWQSIKRMAIFITVFMLLRNLIEFYVVGTSQQIVEIKNLQPGANLTEEVLEMLKRDKQYFNQHIAPVYADGLTGIQIRAIQKWFQNQKSLISSQIKIYEPFPFVAWMFAGAIITLVLKQSLFHLLLGIILT